MNKIFDPPVDQFIRKLEKVESFFPKLAVEEYGKVTSLEQGVAFAKGLPSIAYQELVLFSRGEYGIAFDLGKEEVGIVLLDNSASIQAGDSLYRTNRVVEVPVGEALLGRVLDPLGRALDGKNAPKVKKYRAIEQKSPTILERKEVNEPLLTGLLAIDAMVPIGKGQRELILGDRQIGKTTIGIDAIINQRGKDVICIYCAIGKEDSVVKKAVADLKNEKAIDYTIVISSSGKETPGLNYIAPYAAMSMAEYFMEKGEDVLIIFDDLTRHAWTYRELSLLLRRPPTREAFPGDIFFIHSHLLERATCLQKGGSITALPIIETEEENISAYIPTNLISITDGQIYLTPELYQEGVLPAIDVGKSVSRVGGKTQYPLYRNLIKDLKLFYSQFEELESFSRFGTQLDPETEKKLERGKRVREILKQGRLDLYQVTEQILILFALSSGLFDSLPIPQIAEGKKRLIEAAKEEKEISEKINQGEKITDEEKEKIFQMTKKALEPLAYE